MRILISKHKPEKTVFVFCEYIVMYVYDGFVFRNHFSIIQL